MKESSQLYLKLNECSVPNLYLILEAEYDSLSEMDRVFSKGRLMIALAKRLS